LAVGQSGVGSLEGHEWKLSGEKGTAGKESSGPLKGEPPEPTPSDSSPHMWLITTSAMMLTPAASHASTISANSAGLPRADASE
jgi:hypothetical protein